MNFKNITPEEFDAKRQEPDTVVLDVRPEDEDVEGTIDNKERVNFFDSDFRDQIDKLDRDKTYLLYCRSGNRSGQACMMMGDMGFNHVYNLNGGIKAWNGYKS